MDAKGYIDSLHMKLDETIVSGIYMESAGYRNGFDSLIGFFETIKKNESQVFFAGNGGSAAIATHMTADFMKNGGVKTISLYDPAILTCLGNDYGYEYVFSKQLERLAGKNDLLVAISSSGESQNIINAIGAMKGKGATVLSLTGFDPDNTVRKSSDVCIYVPSKKYGIIESIHNLILQHVVDELMELHGSGY